MELSVFMFMLVALVSSENKVVHEQFVLSGCSNTDKEFMYGVDGEERLYADFVKGVEVDALPDFVEHYPYPGFYDSASADIQICLANLDVAIKAYKNPQEKMDKPQTSIYTKNDVQLNVENVLICHVTGFFPPPVRVSWTKNNEVFKEDSLSQYRPNDDGTYNIFSSLKFTPVEGDIYSCTVNHTSLEEPQTKTWDVEVPVPSVGPAVFCGVGLSLGLLGVAAGTFFLIKGNNCN
ncbi:HLA class II histocompatibility antigen, DP alpha 1 chain-like [Pimephales promelas]|uniref:HLA class II histocompatibility antigen, DP alpha 1 chain-like n=1 Tax=Pimephales promelas TaxID=90988 RepID=UPI001955E759|nr:HLA class II histocompatibility antigen, DP alpha 1 chain-like [Pimephales promelas]KAG1951012.1 HLA class II histocompatibility antigen, DP alpha 1 chain [Pimephales promelas]